MVDGSANGLPQQQQVPRALTQNDEVAAILIGRHDVLRDAVIACSVAGEQAKHLLYHGVVRYHWHNQLLRPDFQSVRRGVRESGAMTDRPVLHEIEFRSLI